ncbi:hypothetical protein HDV05_004049 [Chytridiales sp. JEL 0842]|nr:hypothetical protein HDV05_004049 [Chytridiales sp. JEL 0842]
MKTDETLTEAAVKESSKPPKLKQLHARFKIPLTITTPSSIASPDLLDSKFISLSDTTAPFSAVPNFVPSRDPLESYRALVKLSQTPKTGLFRSLKRIVGWKKVDVTAKTETCPQSTVDGETVAEGDIVDMQGFDSCEEDDEGVNLSPDYSVFKYPKIKNEDLNESVDKTQNRNSKASHQRQSLTFALIRYPLLLFVLLLILWDLLLLFTTKFLVILAENISLLLRPKLRLLKQKLTHAVDYSEYIKHAEELDAHLDLNSWKTETETGHFNITLITSTTARLRKLRRRLESIITQKQQQQQLDSTYSPEIIRSLLARQKEAYTDLQTTLTYTLKHNHGGCLNPSLYSHTHHGTKNVIEDYYEEIERCLPLVALLDSVSVEDRRNLLKDMSRNYGRTGLSFSGGGAIAYCHLGVAKALFDNEMLPEIISGASGGSLMAAMLCCRTNKEILEDGIFTEEVAERACGMLYETWKERLEIYKSKGYTHDPIQGFAALEFATKGHMTFLEAYRHSGRILCIQVVPSEKTFTTQAKVLNFITTPNVVISSAIMASCALPGILPAGQLLCKTERGEYVPYHGAGKGWRDGSFRSDIPDLSYFNVNFTIVSQVNPHIVPFFFEPEGSPGCPTHHRSGRGWRGGFIASSIIHHLDLDLKKWLHLLKDLRLVPKLVDTDISHVFLQKFEGSLTILPSSSNYFSDLIQALDKPSKKRIEEVVRRGASQTFPKMSMIRNRMRLEMGVRRLRGLLKGLNLNEGGDLGGGGGGGGGTGSLLTPMTAGTVITSPRYSYTSDLPSPMNPHQHNGQSMQFTDPLQAYASLIDLPQPSKLGFINTVKSLFRKKRDVDSGEPLGVRGVPDVSGREGDILGFDSCEEDGGLIDDYGLSDSPSQSVFSDSDAPSTSPKKRPQQQLTKKTKPIHPSLQRESLIFLVARYPLLILLCLFIVFDLFLLFTTKLIVTLSENFSLLLHPRLRLLKTQVRSSKSFEEYTALASELDAYLGLDEWKSNETSDHFNASLVLNTTHRLRKLRKRLLSVQEPQKVKDTWSELQTTLTYALKHNHAGTSNTSLYSHTYTGTKKVIEEYYTEIEKCLPLVALCPSVSVSERKGVLKNMSLNYGRTALSLSGGGGNAFYHLGVMKALFEQGLLPEILSGASAGSLMAAMVCCRTDEEIVEDGIFTERMADIAFNMLDVTWADRLKLLRERGYMHDPVQGFDAVSFATKGHMTFLEAYKHSGRILNIQVVPSEKTFTSPPKVLNFLTTPNVLISSAIVATCAVPGILPAGQLLCKTEKGDFVPYDGAGKTWRDGSFRTDIPSLPYFNVNFTIVSQVNPHIVPFFYEPEGSPGCPTHHRSGRGWRGGFVASSLIHHLDLDLKKWLRLLKDLRLIPKFLDTDPSHVFLQNFEGSVTILPLSDNFFSDVSQALNKPTRGRLGGIIECGMGHTFPKVGMVRNRMRLEVCVRRLRSMLNCLNERAGEGLKVNVALRDVYSLFLLNTTESKGKNGMQLRRRKSYKDERGEEESFELELDPHVTSHFHSKTPPAEILKRLLGRYQHGTHWRSLGSDEDEMDGMYDERHFREGVNVMKGRVRGARMPSTLEQQPSEEVIELMPGVVVGASTMGDNHLDPGEGPSSAAPHTNGNMDEATEDEHQLFIEEEDDETNEEEEHGDEDNMAGPSTSASHEPSESSNTNNENSPPSSSSSNEQQASPSTQNKNKRKKKGKSSSKSPVVSFYVELDDENGTKFFEPSQGITGAAKLPQPIPLSTSTHLFKDTVTLFPPPTDPPQPVSPPVSQLKLERGHHTWPFSFRVPSVQSLPPTYRGKLGNVRYETVSILERPMGVLGMNTENPTILKGPVLTKVSRREIPVRSIESRGMRRAFETPVCVNAEAACGSLWWKAGKVEAVARLPRAGFGMSEQIPLTLTLTNHSPSPLSLSSLTLEESATANYPDGTSLGPIITHQIPFPFKTTLPPSTRSQSFFFRLNLPNLEPQTPHPTSPPSPNPQGLNASFTTQLLTLSHHLTFTLRSLRPGSTPNKVCIPLVLVGIRREDSLLYQAARLNQVVQDADLEAMGRASLDTLPVYEPRLSVDGRGTFERLMVNEVGGGEGVRRGSRVGVLLGGLMGRRVSEEGVEIGEDEEDGGDREEPIVEEEQVQEDVEMEREPVEEDVADGISSQSPHVPSSVTTTSPSLSSTPSSNSAASLPLQNLPYQLPSPPAPVSPPHEPPPTYTYAITTSPPSSPLAQPALPPSDIPPISPLEPSPPLSPIESPRTRINRQRQQAMNILRIQPPPEYLPPTSDSVLVLEPVHPQPRDSFFRRSASLSNLSNPHSEDHQHHQQQSHQTLQPPLRRLMRQISLASLRTPPPPSSEPTSPVSPSSTTADMSTHSRQRLHNSISIPHLFFASPRSSFSRPASLVSRSGSGRPEMGRGVSSQTPTPPHAEDEEEQQQQQQEEEHGEVIGVVAPTAEGRLGERDAEMAEGGSENVETIEPSPLPCQPPTNSNQEIRTPQKKKSWAKGLKGSKSFSFLGGFLRRKTSRMDM